MIGIIVVDAGTVGTLHGNEDPTALQVGEDLVHGSDHATTTQDGLVRVDVDTLVALRGVDVNLRRVVKGCVGVLAGDVKQGL